MTWSINCQSSPRHTGWTLSWAGLLTQARAPDNVIMVSQPHPSSVLLLMITACRTRLPALGQSLQVLLGQLCLLKPCPPQLAPAMCEVVVVSLCHLQWKLPVFLNNTKSQASQVLVSLPETRMVNVMG